jgi:DNA-binding response OmpR family regulator
MNPKILVADDSPTIQKVVSITLAGSDYELESAHDESEIFEKLASHSFDLVLLDFNISEETSGYDLAKKIKETSSNTKTLVMLGTFDTVDDHSMTESGVIDQIVKPFESSLFVEKVKAALDGQSGPSPVEVDLEPNESEWVMDNAVTEEIELDSNTLVTDENINPASNPLDEVMLGWGMSVPSVIGESEVATSLPPRMGVSESESALTNGAELIQEIQDNEDYEEVTEEIIMPEAEQLGYPDEDLPSEGQVEPSSKLVSLEELEPDSLIDLEGDEDIDDTDPQFIIGPSEDSPDLIDALEEDVTPDEFWAADESSEFSLGEDESLSSAENSEEEAANLDLIDLSEEEEFQVDQHVPVNIGAESEEIASPTIDALNEISLNEDIGPKLERVEPVFDYDELLSRLKADLKPLILEVVREVSEESNSQAAEKVAWEIIPDLAENLIRKEVEILSKKVQDKHSLS